jgi:putative spermidine/putrescine transport system permease protein
MPWLAGFAALMAAFLVLPELAAIAVSFNPTSRMVVSFTNFSGRWYASLWNHREYLDGFLLSFGIAAVVTVIALMLGGAAAYGTVRMGKRAASVAQALFVAPLVVPATALAVALFLLLDGMRLSDTLTSVLIVHVLATLPYTFRTLLVALRSADPALEEAALSLGASRMDVIRRVTVPLIRPALLASALFAIVVSIDEFTLTWFVAGRAIQTVPIAIFNNTQYGIDPTVAAASTVLIAGSALVMVLLDRAVGLRVAYTVRN